MRRIYNIDLGQKFGELEVVTERVNMEQGAPYCICKCTKCNSEERYKIRDLYKLHPPNGNRICKACFWNSKGGIGAAYGIIKAQAKQRKIEFRLNFDEFSDIVSKDCFWCGREPAERTLRKYQRIHPTVVRNGIDRMDTSKGYETGNCVPCCEQCNIAKMDYTKEEFLNMVKRIYERHFLNFIEVLENQL